MATPFIGEIKMFGGNFAIQNWAFCDGSLLPIDQNDALFSLLGTTYGGNGQTTFALPDLRGRVPIHSGTGPGLSNYVLGQIGGVESVTLTASQIPPHNHNVLAGNGATAPIAGGYLNNASAIYSPPDSTVVMKSSSTAVDGGGNQPHSNLQPFLTINFIISLFGIYPTQN